VTIRELLQWASEHPGLLVAWFVAPPVLVWVIGRLHGPGRGGRSPWRYVYALAIYLASIPGTLAAVLAGYTLFLLRESLLDVNLLLYALPLVSMLATLGLAKRSVEFDEVPGFERLSGLIILLVVTFSIVLFIAKTRIWIWFGSSLLVLGVMALIVFGLLKWAASRLFGDGGRRQP
jgi:hypothetical protein